MLVANQAAAWVTLPWLLALRSQLVPHKLTTTHQFFIQALFWEGRRNLPQGKLPKSQKYPMISNYVHELDKELLFTEQIQHVLADRTNCRVRVASLCLLRYVL